MNTLESALLAKADAALDQADLLLKAGHPDGAADRCYYAMFHAASALLASKGLQYTSHRAVLAAVGKELVQPGLLAPKHHRAILNAFDMRQTADYDVRADLDIGNVEQACAEAREFATVVRAALGRRAGA